MQSDSNMNDSALHPQMVHDCSDTFCIAEKRPFYDETIGECSCEWIPGLEQDEGSIDIYA